MASSAPQTRSTDRLKLRTLLAPKPWNRPLRDGSLASELFELDFDDIEEASEHFKPFIREMAYDCGELAIASHFQAIACGKPLAMLPVAVAGNFQHGSIGYDGSKGTMVPSDLAGKRVGIRTYAQTTGLWARGILQNDFGVDLSTITWVTLREGHVAELADPENCVRAPAGSSLAAMVLDGEIDAAVLGAKMPDDGRFRSLITDPAQAAKAWQDEHGVRPINHMFVVNKSLCDEHPEMVRALYDLLKASWATTECPFPIGLDGDWTALKLAGEYAYQQQIVPRRFSVDELFADFAKVMGR